MAKGKKYDFVGLDEIFGDSVSDLVGSLENDPNKAKEISEKINIELLIPNKFQPRKIFDEETLIELSESIKLNGIIQPIIVKKNNSNYEIIAGERRTRAAKLAGLKEVPVVILNVSDEQLEEFAIIENIQRVDLSDIEEAIAYKNLSKKFKQEEIAKKVAKSRSHISNVMRLLNLPEYIQKDMLDGIISMGQAKPLLSILSNEELVKVIYNKIIRFNISSREVEQLIKSEGKEKINSKKTKGSDYIRVENTLMKKFGTRVNVDDRKISINYKGTKDLNRILEILEVSFED